MSLLRKKLTDLHTKLDKKEITATDLVEESLRRIEEVEDEVHAFITVDEEGARARAKELDEKFSGSSEKGLLAALPVGIKDNINTEGLTTTCASQLLANYVPVYDATVVKKLAQADTVVMGKMNMDEFAMGSSNETSSFYPVHNPWDLQRIAGGSSGGSAAAVAAGEVYFSLGSDTGGSIRQPAAFCGVVGLKPTYGLVSRFGLIAFASSLDQIGPMTKNVEDAAYVMNAIAGHDSMDSTSAQVDIPDYLSALTGEIKGLRVGVPKEMMGEGVTPEVKESIKKALKQLEDLGAIVEEVSLPHSEYAVAAYYLLTSAEASSNLARFDGVRYGVRKGENLHDLYLETRSQGFGSEVKRRIILGTFALSSGNYEDYYLKAQKVRTLVCQDYENVFADYDVIVGPTAPTTAFRMGETEDDPVTTYHRDISTIPVNLAGLPAISVPAEPADGLPVGLQIIGKPFAESTILRVAHAYEQARGEIAWPKLGGKRA